MAIDPNGKFLRAKILSSSSFRGTVKRRLDSRTFLVEQKWGAAEGLVGGLQFKLAGSSLSGVEIAEWSPEKSVIKLKRPLDAAVGPGTPFELISREESPVLAARVVTGTPLGKKLPPMEMRLGTTRGTNALLERRGAKLALFVTRGFEDLVKIGTQQRRELFSLDIRPPRQLYAHVVGVEERVGADGRVIEPLKIRQLRERVKHLLQEGINVAAVALLNSYRNPAHEKALALFLERSGFRFVSCSSALAPLIRILPRCETAVVDAYLAPVIGSYLRALASALGRSRLWIMTSAGGLVGAGDYRPKDSLLSGPAGGVAGAAAAGKMSGFDKVISFDMGGTSTDVARYDGDFEYVFEQRVGDAHLLAPALAIQSVAAGGGSILSFDGARLRVGPESAGAHPGPACYGSGGPLTLTDANLLLGRLDPQRFEMPIYPKRAEQALERIMRAILRRTGEKVEREEVLEAFLEIANERMADAIRSVSLRRGYDPASYTLVAFGGAGGQHACSVARHLGVRTILVPQEAGLLSAVGLGSAVVERFAEAQILKPLSEIEGSLGGIIRQLERQALGCVAREGLRRSEIEIRRRIVTCRFLGQESALALEYYEGEALRQAFRERYRALFGYVPQGRQIEVEAVRVVASSRRLAFSSRSAFVKATAQPVPVTTKAYIGGRWRAIFRYERAHLGAGWSAAGPCLIVESHTTILVEPGWRASVDNRMALILRRSRAKRAEAERKRPRTAELELFTNRLETIATEMGSMLERTALSTNVKERLDFSCAIFDAGGDLVVNAPHIPVHLGGLGLCVKGVMRALEMGPGDAVVTNHPAFGGTHLPDVTVITPVFWRKKRLVGYVASRAHHAEIGGTRPGSMPPRARTLAEEGVVIPPSYLIKRGRGHWEEMAELLARAPHPSRAVEENLADMRAAVAANNHGVRALCEIVSAWGPAKVGRYMKWLKRYARERVGRALARVGAGRYAAIERLDDGTPLRVAIVIGGRRATFDFSRSGGVHPGNLNATPAVVRSVVMYVLRLLVGEPLPLNDGMMQAVHLRLPCGILNPTFADDPRLAPAVGGGNVETSQRLVDLLLKALRLAACSQGTMNNVVLGTQAYSYYETICGGCGAGPGFAGASAVHSHMTNTRITDCEVIERRYPVRVVRFGIRKGSGGPGRYRGGDGAIREILFLDRMELSLLTQHRTVAPYGMAGGRPGKCGRQLVARASGRVVELPSVAATQVCPGDRLVIETPGGGGWGRATCARGYHGTRSR